MRQKSRLSCPGISDCQPPRRPNIHTAPLAKKARPDSTLFHSPGRSRLKRETQRELQIARCTAGSGAGNGADRGRSQRRRGQRKVGSVGYVVRFKAGLQRIALLDFKVFEDRAIQVTERWPEKNIASFGTNCSYWLRCERGRIKPFLYSRIREIRTPNHVRTVAADTGIALWSRIQH